MKYLLEFSLENREASRQEIEAIQEAYSSFNIEEINREIAVVEGSIEELKCASFVNVISEILMVAEDYEDFKSARIPEGTFYVRLKDTNGCHSQLIEPELGNILGARGRVSFENPDFKVRVIHQDHWFLTRVLFKRDKKELEKRRAPLRPFFSPVSLHPKYAKYLVNLSRTRKGDTIFDPFCGTGGILIEAGILGRKLIGTDISLNMVVGARLNLKYFGIKDYNIYNQDLLKFQSDSKVDAIVTDMPYGKNASLKEYKLEQLYRDSFAKFHNLLKDDGFCTLALSKKEHLKYAEGLFEILSCLEVPQHKSLTRYFVSLKKIEPNKCS